MANKPDPRADSLLIPDMATMINEFKNGKPVGESAQVEHLEKNFSWKRTFVNCFTGWPGDGKSTYGMFMSLLKSVKDNWKWCIWTPEMINAHKGDDGKVYLNPSDIYDELVFMLTGKNPYKHFTERYKIPQMSVDEYVNAIETLQKWFLVIQPKDRKYSDLIDNFRYHHEVNGIDGFWIDPFKNIDQRDVKERTDLYLDEVFGTTKDFAIETNSVFNYIAHPRNINEPKEPDGSFKVCTQFMLNGGASWNNNMDGVYSIQRPQRHRDGTDSQVVFWSLKQRKQQLVGRVGKCDGINFDFFTNRFYFNGICPIDGSTKQFNNVQPEEKPTYPRRGKKQPQQPPLEFKSHILNFSEPQTPDEPPF